MDEVSWVSWYLCTKWREKWNWFKAKKKNWLQNFFDWPPDAYGSSFIFHALQPGTVNVSTVVHGIRRLNKLWTCSVTFSFLFDLWENLFHLYVIPGQQTLIHMRCFNDVGEKIFKPKKRPWRSFYTDRSMMELYASIIISIAFLI